jgi:hypothetical protein
MLTDSVAIVLYDLSNRACGMHRSPASMASNPAMPCVEPVCKLFIRIRNVVARNDFASSTPGAERGVEKHQNFCLGPILPIM